MFFGPHKVAFISSKAVSKLDSVIKEIFSMGNLSGDNLSNFSGFFDVCFECTLEGHGFDEPSPENVYVFSISYEGVLKRLDWPHIS